MATTTSNCDAELRAKLENGDLTAAPDPRPRNPSALLSALLQKLELLCDQVAAIQNQLGHSGNSEIRRRRGTERDVLITLSQAAALVQRSKCSLRKYKHHPLTPLPEPEVRGERGQPSEYRWDEMKPWLELVFHRVLPNEPPSINKN